MTALSGQPSVPAQAAADAAWHALTPDEVAKPPRGRSGHRLDDRRGRLAACRSTARTLSTGEEGVALADVQPPVRGPDADRAPHRGHRLPLPARPVLHRRLPDRADPVQRLDGDEPGRQGGGERVGPRGHDGRQGQGPPRRRARRGPDGRARPGRHREHRGRRPRPGRRPHPRRRDPRDRRVRAHGREHPHAQAGRSGRTRCRPRRPRGHGVHELPGHPGSRAPSSSRPPGWRPRSATSAACSRPRRSRRRR